MTLAAKTKIALDESRMLMLGAQILLGFQLQAPFQTAFERLDGCAVAAEFSALSIMVVVIALLIAPSARHRIVEAGEATIGINRSITRMAFVTLLPFSVALGLDLFIVGSQIGDPALGLVFGLAAFLVAAAAWYGPLIARAKPRDNDMSNDQTTSTAEKINFVLTEARVVLPGAQALLGFQFVIVLTAGFAELSPALKCLHGAAIGMITVATILLITPAAYHRIVYDGSDVADFYRVASRLLLAATVFLAFGLSADLYVVAHKITGSAYLSTTLAAGSIVLLVGLWHAWPFWLRSRGQ
jgi:hypothetical protein